MTDNEPSDATPPGIEVAGVSAWLNDRAAVTGALDFDLVVGGRSNLTFILADEAGAKWVLRRPPTGHVLPKAHDMGREHDIMAALRDSDVPVPNVVGLCNDNEVTGAPFYVMDFVDGQVIRNADDARDLSLEARAAISTDLVATLAKLHAIDPDEVGLGELGKREDYIGRQLRRWMRQIEQGAERELPILHEVHATLAAKQPPQRGAGIVHGDYRLDNCMIGADNQVAAVLDWELCTLGDTLADVGLLVTYWGDRDSDSQVLEASATMLEGFASIDEVSALYAKTSGQDVSTLPYYVSFALWRLACILEGVYTRFKNNAMGDQGLDPEQFGDQVVALLEAARTAADQL